MLTISLPYSIYRVPIDSKGSVVNLSKNSQGRYGAGHQRLIRKARRQMAEDTSLLMRGTGWPTMTTPLVMDATIKTRTRSKKDDDGAIMGLVSARDSIAVALGINDSEISSGKIEFQVGIPEETEIRVYQNNLL